MDINHKINSDQYVNMFWGKITQLFTKDRCQTAVCKGSPETMKFQMQFEDSAGFRKEKHFLNIDHVQEGISWPWSWGTSI